LFQLIRGQRRQGLKPSLLILSQGGCYARKTAELGVDVHELMQTSAFDWASGRRFVKVARDFDIIHFQTQSPILMRSAIKLGGVKLAYTHRGGVHQHSLKRRMMYRWTGRTLRTNFPLLSGNTSHAASVAARLFRIPQEKIHVTYNGIDFSLLQPDATPEAQWQALGGEPAPGSCVIGTCANLRNWKRIDLLIAAIGRLDDVPVRCLVIGDGQAKRALQRLAAELGLGDRIQFVGQQENVANYLQLLNLFVLPSNDGESFGNSVVEAIGLGIPTIVMNDCGGMREHFPDDLRTFPQNARDLANRIRQFAVDRDLANRFASRCQDYVLNKYTIDNMVAGYQRLYDQVPI
jgi:glycosyltransferase involved in cell wall biosynthesis